MEFSERKTPEKNGEEITPFTRKSPVLLRVRQSNICRSETARSPFPLMSKWPPIKVRFLAKIDVSRFRSEH